MFLLDSRYHNQAAKDSEVVFRCVQHLLHQLNQPSDTITEKEVRLFCKNSNTVHLVRGTSVADEYDPKTPNAQNIGGYCLNKGAMEFEKEYASEIDQLVTLTEFLMSQQKQACIGIYNYKSPLMAWTVNRSER